MKSKLSLGLLLCFLTNISFANDVWVPYIPAPVPILTQPVVEVPLIPSVTYSTMLRPVSITYGWVPYTINKPIVVEKRCLFCRYSYIIYQPSIEWVYQPIYR